MRRVLAAASLLVGCASLIGVGELTVGDASAPDVEVQEAGATACGWPGPDAGLLAYYPFDEDAGGIVHDCSGNQQYGQFATPQTGWAPVDGHRGGAIAIDANGNGCVDLPLTLVPEGATFSVSAWVTASTYPQSFATIIGHHGSGTSNKGWRVSMSSLDAGASFIELRVFALDGGDYEAFGPRMGINDGWHHVVVTYSQGVASNVVLDDASVKGAPPPPVLPDQSVHIRIGCRGDQAYAFPFVGKIDEVRIYDHALDAGEIAELEK